MFNVDVAARVNLSPSVTGCAFFGRTKSSILIFMKLVGTIYSRRIGASLAIKQALVLSESSFLWYLIIESDSRNIIYWLIPKRERLWRIEIRDLCSSLKTVF